MRSGRSTPELIPGHCWINLTSKMFYSNSVNWNVAGLGSIERRDDDHPARSHHHHQRDLPGSAPCFLDDSMFTLIRLVSFPLLFAYHNIPHTSTSTKLAYCKARENQFLMLHQSCEPVPFFPWTMSMRIWGAAISWWNPTWRSMQSQLIPFLGVKETWIGIDTVWWWFDRRGTIKRHRKSFSKSYDVSTPPSLDWKIPWPWCNGILTRFIWISWKRRTICPWSQLNGKVDLRDKFRRNECTGLFSTIENVTNRYQTSYKCQSGKHLLDQTRSNTRLERYQRSCWQKRFHGAPFCPDILREGEYSMFYFGGTISHVILKTPRDNDFRVQEEFEGRHQVVLEPLPIYACLHCSGGSRRCHFMLGSSALQWYICPDGSRASGTIHASQYGSNVSSALRSSHNRMFGAKESEAQMTHSVTMPDPKPLDSAKDKHNGKDHARTKSIVVPVTARSVQ